MFDLFPAITITDSTPFTWTPPEHLRSLSVAVSGADVYFGYPHPLAVAGTGIKVSVDQTLIGTNKFSLNLLNAELADTSPQGYSLRNIAPGWVFTDPDDNVDDGLYVVRVYETYLVMNDNFTSNHQPNTGFSTFTPPVVSSTNGLLIPDGGDRTWHSSNDSQILRRKIQFVVAAAATATLRLGYQVY